MLHIPGLFVASSEGRGRGVFTAVNLQPGDFIESCPAIVIPPEEIKLIDQTIFYNYYFNWPQPTGSACIPLGYGCIYNHSTQPNAAIALDLHHNRMELHCIEATEAGEEIFIDYLGGEKDTESLWFEEI